MTRKIKTKTIQHKTKTKHNVTYNTRQRQKSMEDNFFADKGRDKARITNIRYSRERQSRQKKTGTDRERSTQGPDKDKTNGRIHNKDKY